MIAPAPAVVVLQVVILRDGLLVGSEIFFPGRYTIGSAEDADLRLVDAWVDPKHALLHFEPDKTVVENLSPQAGTFINGHKISRCELRPIDELGCGPYLLKIRVLTQQEETAPKPDPPSSPALHLAPAGPVPAAPSGTVLSTRRRTEQGLAAVTFDLAAPVGNEPTQNVTMVQEQEERPSAEETEGVARLFLELRWNGAVRELRSFPFANSPVLASSENEDDDGAFPLGGFTLSEEPFTLARAEDEEGHFRLFIPPQARVERQRASETARSPVTPETLSLEKGIAFVSLGEGDVVILMEGSMELSASVKRVLKATSVSTWTPARRRLLISIGLTFAGFLSFLGVIQHRARKLPAVVPQSMAAATAGVHRAPIVQAPTAPSPEASPSGAVESPSPVPATSATPSAAVGKVLSRRVGVLGALDRRGIARVVNAHLPAFQGCYEQALQETPGLKGKLTLEWTVAPTGHVASARVRRPSPFGRSIESCLVQSLKALQFPAPRGGSAVVSYPFSFEPAQ